VTITLYEGPLEDFATKAAQDRQFVVALARGLEILRVYMPGETLLTNSQIAARTKLPKATVSRLTHTLTELGYLTYEKPSRGYKLGDAVIGLGYGVLSGLDISRRARPDMQVLAQETGMEVTLSRRDRLSMVVIERVTLPGSRTSCIALGSRIPVAATATGRAFLAALSDDDRSFLLSLLDERAPEHLREMRPGLERALEDFRREGYCISIGEWDSTVTAVAVPVLTPDREVEAVLAGGIPTRFMTEERLRSQIAPRFVRAAAKLSRPFGLAEESRGAA